ncbi:glycosyltransferase [Deferrisoma sp.]
MKVVHVDLGGRWRGGQQQVFLLHRELRRMGVDSVVVAPPEGGLPARCSEAGLPVTTLSGRRWWNPDVWLTLRRACRGADLVHAHDAHAASSLAIALRRGEAKVVCHRRVSYPLRPGMRFRLTYGRADAWIAVSAEIAESVRRAGAVCPVEVVPSAIEVDDLRARAHRLDREDVLRRWGVRDERPVLGVVGAFTEQKGHRVLVEALPRLLREWPGLVCVFVGEGPLEPAIRELARARRVLDRCRFLGFLGDAPVLTRCLDVAVLPSVSGEGSSAALKEPMALGVPIVCSDLPGNVEVVGDAGWVVPRGNPAALAEAIDRVLRDEESRAARVRAGFQRVERFRPGTMARRTLSVYERVLS